MNLDPNLIQRVLSNAHWRGLDRVETLGKLERFNSLLAELNIDPSTLGMPTDYSRAALSCIECNKAFIPASHRQTKYCSFRCGHRRHQRTWERKKRAKLGNKRPL